MGKTFVAYHGDDDGKCAASIVVNKTQDVALADMAALNYGYDEDKFLSMVGDHIDRVYFVDFTPRKSTLEKLLDRGLLIIIIDHHKTSAERFAEDFDLAPLQEGTTLCKLGEGWHTHKRVYYHYRSALAGCEATWEFLNTEDSDITKTDIKSMPLVVQLVGRYDVWDHDYDERVYPFHQGFMLTENDPTTEIGREFWEHLLNEDLREARDVVWEGINQIVNMGHMALEVRKTMEERVLSKRFTAEFGGLKFLCVNGTLVDSKSWVGYYEDTDVDALCTFTYSPKYKCWSFSLRAREDKRDVDVSKVAVQYGGGGHAGAAGFNTNELPFELGLDAVGNR